MRLLRTDIEELQLESFADHIPKYAILSHRWYFDGEEVTFSDVINDRDVRPKRGWGKLQSSKRQAVNDGLDYIWIDTCCIDKSSSQELTEAINSMFKFYRNAETCYVYLHDVPMHMQPGESSSTLSTPHQDDRILSPVHEPHKGQPESRRDCPAHDPMERHSAASTDVDIELGSMSARHEAREGETMSSAAREILQSRDLESFARSDWFTRGWTLQELLAPKPGNVHFYDSQWSKIADLLSIADQVAQVTRIRRDLLLGQRTLDSFSVAQKMSWAAGRVTSRQEDRAYSLVGIFGISLDARYGEGEAAFQRLQEELIRHYKDDSIFAWGLVRDVELFSGAATDSGRFAGISFLASSPDDFRESANIGLNPMPANSSFYLRDDSIDFRAPFRGMPEHKHWWARFYSAQPRTKYPCDAILSCLPEENYSSYIILHLHQVESESESGVSSRYFVYGRTIARISDAIVRGDYSLKSFTLARTPGKKAPARPTSVRFELESNMHIQPREISLGGRWYEDAQRLDNIEAAFDALCLVEVGGIAFTLRVTQSEIFPADDVSSCSFRFEEFATYHRLTSGHTRPNGYPIYNTLAIRWGLHRSLVMFAFTVSKAPYGRKLYQVQLGHKRTIYLIPRSIAIICFQLLDQIVWHTTVLFLHALGFIFSPGRRMLSGTLMIAGLFSFVIWLVTHLLHLS